MIYSTTLKVFISFSFSIFIEKVKLINKYKIVFDKTEQSSKSTFYLTFIDLTTDELWKKMSGLRTYYGKGPGKERASKVSGNGAFFLKYKHF